MVVLSIHANTVPIQPQAEQNVSFGDLLLDVL